jgi:AcrR family transcriptional regulator
VIETEVLAMGSDERPDGRSRILDAAHAIVDSSGEAALRFADVAETAGVALSVITHHFGTREGLVAAVHARRFAGLVAEDVGQIAVLVGVSTSEDITAAVTRIT